MKTLAQALLFLGAFHALAFVFGSLNIIDYKVCLKERGMCSQEEKK